MLAYIKLKKLFKRLDSKIKVIVMSSVKVNLLYLIVGYLVAFDICNYIGYRINAILGAILMFFLPIVVVLGILTNKAGIGIKDDNLIIVDYAHTPDGLKNILKTYKKCAKNRLILLFGCGGDRDKSKRALMGEIASIYADFVIVTSDNPRTENPQEIINDIVKGVPNALFNGKIIEDRAKAIKFALSIAQKDDIIVLAGKGHETYQIIGKEKFPFNEREIVVSALQNLD